MAKAVKKSLFDNAESIPLSTKKSKKEATIVNFPSPFDVLVNLKIVEKHISEISENLEMQFKNGAAFDVFFEAIKENMRQPESFVANCDNVQAQFQYAKQTHGFKSEVKDILDKYDIEYDTKSKMEERFILNPDIFENKKLLKKIEAALLKIQDEEGVDIIKKQDAVNSYQFNDNTIKGIVEKIKNPEEQAELLKDKSLATIKIAACKFNNTEDSVDKALSNLVKMDILKFSKKK